VKLNGKTVSASELRRIGFALVNIATAYDRAALQAAQARANPNEREVYEAKAAADRVRSAVTIYRGMIA